MALTILNNLDSLRQGRLMRLANLYTITRTDGVVFRLTNHNSPISYGGFLYEPANGVQSSAFQKQTGLRPRDMEMNGVLTSDRITDSDLHAGKFDNARVEVLLVDWLYPWAGSFDRSVFTIERVSFSGEHWDATLTGLVGLLKAKQGEVVTRTCQNRLGDSICRINLATSTITRSIATVTSIRRIFTVTIGSITNPYNGAAVSDGYFDGGTVTWASGSNNGLVGEIKSHVGNTIELELEMPFDIAVSDSVNIRPGCDGLFTTCQTKFQNKPNFKGCPDVPGTDKMLYAN